MILGQEKTEGSLVLLQDPGMLQLLRPSSCCDVTIVDRVVQVVQGYRQCFQVITGIYSFLVNDTSLSTREMLQGLFQKGIFFENTYK